MALSVKILGSNSASFAHNRHHSAQILQIQDQYFLIDCGEGTQLQLKKFGVKISRIDHILISHLHGDHYYGLIGLISTMHLYGRKKTLFMVGPPGLAEIITIQLRYSETDLNFPIEFIEWSKGEKRQILENEKITIETIPLDHRIPCSGYLFKEKHKKRRINKDKLEKKLSPAQIMALRNGEDIKDENGTVLFSSKEVTLPPHRSFSYAYCSDTRFDPGIVEQIKNVDILYHEATFANDMADRAHNTYHSTAEQAATIAQKADVRKLLIGHFSTRYKNLHEVLGEAKNVFQDTELAIEGQTYVVNK